MIRLATKQDVPRIIELGAQLHAGSSYADQEFVPEAAADFIGKLIDGEGVVFVAQKQGAVVGGLAGGIVTQWFSTQKLAFDYSFFIESSQRHGITALRLLRAFELWAIGMGASRLQVGITTGINVDGTSRLFRADGFADAGVFFEKAL